MEQKNEQQSEANKSPELDPEQIAILNNFEVDINKQARALQDSLSDMSAHKLASVLYKCFLSFMV